MSDQKREKTGLLFGSFNPVHTGHLIIASYFVQHTDLGKIWFVLSPQNPFKTGEKLLEDSKRLELLHLAVNDNANFHICDIEFSMKKPSYTVNTINKLQQQYPEREFVLLIGTDNLNELDRWKNYEEILSMVVVYVYPRRDKASSKLLTHPSVKLVDAPLIEISSTQIREDIRAGRQPRYLLPDSVLKEITDKRYY